MHRSDLAPETTRPARLPQIDVMRLLICVSVVVLHVVGNANPQSSVAANGAVNLLHYSRQAFFFISALVLVHASRRGPGQMRRRVSVLGIPYLVWSTVYAVLGLVTAYSLWATKRLPWTWFVGLVQGTDGYHMYFLLVSVEFAVVFPLFLRLLEATRGHHRTLLVVSGLLELAVMAEYHYGYLPDGWWRPIAGESSLTAYQFWVIAGGVAAMHLDAFHGWLVRHSWLVWAGLAGTCALATGLYAANMAAGESPEYAGLSLQPLTVPLSVAAIGAFYLLSVRIGEIRNARVRRAIDFGTYLSFGIYLSHPLLLTGLLYVQRGLPHAVTRYALPVTVAMCLLDVALSLALAALLSRTAWSKALVGRPRKRGARPAPAPLAVDLTTREPAPAQG